MARIREGHHHPCHQCYPWFDYLICACARNSNAEALASARRILANASGFSPIRFVLRILANASGWYGRFEHCHLGSVGFQLGKKRSQYFSVMAPAADGMRIDRLPHLGKAGGVYGSACLVKSYAGWLPLQPAARDQPPRFGFQVRDDIFVRHLEDGHRQHLPPVRHELPILPEVREDRVLVVGPVELFEVRQPAGEGDVTQVPPAVNKPVRAETALPGRQGRGSCRAFYRRYAPPHG